MAMPQQGSHEKQKRAKRHWQTDLSDLSALREASATDDQYCDLVAYALNGQLPVAPEAATAVKKRSKNLSLRDGLLVRSITTQGIEREQLYIPESLRPLYLTAFHDQQGHVGREKSYMSMARQVYWPGMWEDLTDHINACHECSFCKRSARPEGQAHTPTIGDCPFDEILVDVLSMDDHPTTKGNKKVLVFFDSLTRWAEAVALPGEPTSIEVLDHFMELVVSRYGFPLRVRSDSGSNLSSALVQSVYEHYEVEMRLGTPEHHQSQGAVERFNDTLVGMTRAACLTGGDWDDHLPFLLYTYRATPHRVTGHSPAYLLYGRELRAPAPTSLSRDVDPGAMTPEQRSNAARLVGGMRLAWASAAQATRDAQLASRDKSDLLHDHALTFVPNERVLVRREGLLPKLAPRYEGPYRVTEVLPDGNYKLRDLTSRRRRTTIHVSRLRPYLTITDAERLSPDEYLIERLLNRRDRNLPDGTVSQEYLVKWQGYPKAEATWTPRSLLVNASMSLVVCAWRTEQWEVRSAHRKHCRCTRE